MPTAFPEKLDRLPYLYRWLVLSGTAAVLFYLIFLITLHTSMEPLVLIPSVGWFVVKMLLLDPSRMRSIGWSPKISFLSLLPPVAIFLQLLLFSMSGKRT
jgi:hypothetical protein